jgi:hypothetical protein
MTTWEHKFVLFRPGMNSQTDINQMLAEHGAQGWELVHYATPHVTNVWTFAFKRPVSPDAS